MRTAAAASVSIVFVTEKDLLTYFVDKTLIDNLIEV